MNAAIPSNSPEGRPCPLCGEPKPAHFISHQGHELFRCRDCGLVYLDPAPTNADIAQMYDDPYSGATESYFTKVEKKMRRSRIRARRMARMMAGGAAGKSFLDVGANGGFMAEAAREAGFRATGVEPDGPAVDYARRHYPANDFVRGTIEEADLGGRRFDAVYCSEVIEHAPDCNRFVAALARVMRPQGLLYLTTPDISHWRVPRDLGRWDAFCPPAHCLFFSPGNLARLLDRHGFKVVRKLIAIKPGIKILARRVESGG
mgnify:FL=1